jgi:hypothetical protein
MSDACPKDAIKLAARFPASPILADMNFPLGTASGTLAETKRDLEAARLEVAGLAQRVQGFIAAVPRVSPGEWSGPASEAYGAACDQVARDCYVGLAHLNTAGSLLLVALGELDAHA